VNNDQKKVLFNKVVKHFDGLLKDKTFAVWGLSFKPGTDDMREASSLVLIESLLSAGAKVRVFDPVAAHEAKKTLQDSVEWCNDMYHAAEGADAVLLVTEWNEFRLPDWTRIKGSLKSAVVFDGRNIYDNTYLEKNGFICYSIGIAQPAVSVLSGN